jgi:flagellar basal-body rod protein FlgF
MYTRNGHMQRAADGTLVTSSGAPVLDADGNTIDIAENELQIKIAKDGTISGSSGQLAKLAIVEFAPEDEQSIEKAGNSLFTATAKPAPAVKAQLLQGMVEGSNVEPIKEMTTMMQIARAYEQTAHILEEYQKMQTSATNSLGKVS